MNGSRPLIGITTHTTRSRRGAGQISCSRTYFEAVEAAGGAPFGIPYSGDEALESLFEAMDGLLLPGGGDVAPRIYSEEPIPQNGEVEDERDRLELTLARWALDRNKPLLAICRGIQVLNVASGGTLYQDIPTQRPASLDHRKSTKRRDRGFVAHSLEVEPHTRLARAIGEGTHPVNTHHHQAVKDVGEGLVITGRSEDGVIEAIESETLSWAVGVQCHPEEMWREHEWARSLFRAFVEEAAYQAEPHEVRVIGALKRPNGV